MNNVRDASIKDVARLAGVSIATVSRCMNFPEKVSEKTRLKVQAAIYNTGYSPNTLAQSFRRGHTNIIMVVLPSVGDPFFSAVMRGIRVAARAKGYSVIFEDTQFNKMTDDDLGTMLVSNQIDGIILGDGVYVHPGLQHRHISSPVSYFLLDANTKSRKSVKKLKQRDLMLMKLEKKLMIGIFLKKEEKDKQKEWQTLQ